MQGTLILFGSYAKGYATKESDVDLFIIGKADPSLFKKIGKRHNLTVNLKTASTTAFEKGMRTGDTLVKEVVKDHILLYNKDSFIQTMWRFAHETA